MGGPEEISCSTKFCQKVEQYAEESCEVMDFSEGCDICDEEKPCPTIVIIGPAICKTYLCQPHQSPAYPYRISLLIVSCKL